MLGAKIYDDFHDNRALLEKLKDRADLLMKLRSNSEANVVPVKGHPGVVDTIDALVNLRKFSAKEKRALFVIDTTLNPR
jgi:hypothetical protein